MSRRLDDEKLAATGRASVPEWLVEGGELGALIRSTDWSRTLMGPRDAWPESLRTAVGIVVASRFPMALLWGDELILVYNDAYASSRGANLRPRSATTGSSGPRSHIQSPSCATVVERRRRSPRARSSHATTTASPRGVYSRCATAPCAPRAARIVGTLVTLQDHLQVLGGSGNATRRSSCADQRAPAPCVALARLRIHVGPTPLALVSGMPSTGWSGHRRARELFGWTAGEVMGAASTRNPHDPGGGTSLRCTRSMRDMSSGTRPANVNTNRNFRKDSSVRTARAPYSSGPRRSSSTARASCSPRSERHRCGEGPEAALRDADRRKDEFLAMLSHELRNPLAPIRNALYILDRADPAGAAGAPREGGRERGRSAHLTRLVDDLLDVTRIARGKIRAAPRRARPRRARRAGRRGPPRADRERAASA